ncbi:MAG: hypothetical protein HC771_20225 [Synechococcales cyanobacterium CRU_2_2]|nr:hypothetical protein [Synechococcales cyanobacterium CRU_2_2]
MTPCWVAEDEDEFTVLEELGLATADLRGYAGQVQVRGWVEDEAGAIARLQQLRLLGVPAIARFYFEEGDRYPLLKAYVLRLDYLRLLVLEFLQMGAGAQSAWGPLCWQPLRASRSPEKPAPPQRHMMTRY